MLGEVIEDDNPAPISVEAAFARLWQIRTIKSVILGFAAMGFGLFTTGVLANLFMEEQYGTKTFARGVLGIHRRHRAPRSPCHSPAATTTASTGEIPRKALRLVGLDDHARRDPHAGAVLHAERARCS